MSGNKLTNYYISIIYNMVGKNITNKIKRIALALTLVLLILYRI
jgi:hypothetical protein